MIETIVAAVVAGVAAGAGTASTTAVTDAYTALTDKIRRLLHRNAGTDPIAEIEADPEAGRPQLTAALTEARADQDTELVESAQHLLALIAPSKYRVDVHNSQGVIVGDNTTATFTFGAQ